MKYLKTRFPKPRPRAGPYPRGLTVPGARPCPGARPRTRNMNHPRARLRPRARPRNRVRPKVWSPSKPGGLLHWVLNRSAHHPQEEPQDASAVGFCRQSRASSAWSTEMDSNYQDGERPSLKGKEPEWDRLKLIGLASPNNWDKDSDTR